MTTFTRPLQVPRWRRYVRGVGGLRVYQWLPLLVLILVVAAGALASWVAPHDPDRAVLRAALASPDWVGDHPFGTDNLGRDVLSRTLYGLRTSLIVAIGSVAISAGVGVPLGIAAGYAGSYLETFIMRIVDVQMSIPGILLLVVLAFIIGPGLVTTMVILGIAGWVRYARMSRAETLVVSRQDYILAARSIGARPLRIAVRHLLPNITNSLVVLATLQFGQSIILEASISFLGFGVQPPTSSLGIMVADGRSMINLAWWIITFPSIVLFVTVLAVNLIGDAIQDWVDPVRKRRA